MEEKKEDIIKHTYYIELKVSNPIGEDYIIYRPYVTDCKSRAYREGKTMELVTDGRLIRVLSTFEMITKVKITQLKLSLGFFFPPGWNKHLS